MATYQRATTSVGQDIAGHSSSRRTINVHASDDLARIAVQGDACNATLPRSCTIVSAGHPVAAAPSAHMQLLYSHAMPFRLKPASQLPQSAVPSVLQDAPVAAVLSLYMQVLNSHALPFRVKPASQLPQSAVPSVAQDTQ